MKSIIAIIAGVVIAFGCLYKLFSLPIFTSPSINQWWLYGAIAGGIIAYIGITNLTNDGK